MKKRNKPSILAARFRGILRFVLEVSTYFIWSLIKALYAYVWFFYDTASNVEGLMILFGLVIIIALIPTPGLNDISERQRLVCWLAVGVTLGLVYNLFPPEPMSVLPRVSV